MISGILISSLRRTAKRNFKMIRFQKSATSKYLVFEQTTDASGNVNLFKLFCDNAADMHKALNDNWNRWQETSKLYGTSQVHLATSNNYKPYNLPVLAVKTQCKRSTGRYVVATATFSTGKAELSVIAL